MDTVRGFWHTEGMSNQKDQRQVLAHAAEVNAMGFEVTGILLEAGWDVSYYRIHGSPAEVLGEWGVNLRSKDVEVSEVGYGITVGKAMAAAIDLCLGELP